MKYLILVITSSLMSFGSYASGKSFCEGLKADRKISSGMLYALASLAKEYPSVSNHIDITLKDKYFSSDEKISTCALINKEFEKNRTVSANKE